MFKHLAAIAVASLALTGGAFAQDLTGGDIEAGQKVFNKCKACHMVGASAKSRVGPALNGVIGAEWGIAEGFRYSKSLTEMAEAEGKKWDLATLDAYLENPKAVIPRGRMAFGGLKKADERINVIAYLAQFDAEGNEVDPAPVLEAAATAEGS